MRFLLHLCAVVFSTLLRPAICTALCAAAFGVAAQGYPQRPVHVILPYAAGTGSDVVTRLMLASLGERLGQPVVFDNKPGAGGVLGGKLLKDAKPDGYTIGLLVSGYAIQPWINKDMPFDVRKDFAPITLIYSGPLAMTVPATLPVRSVSDFVTYAKTHPTFFASPGRGTTGHLVAEMLNSSAGLSMTHVPFKGTPEGYSAMLGGNVQTMFDNYNTPKPMVEAGKLRALAVTSVQRVPWLPDVPTMAETYPGFEASFWVGVAAPAGAPQEALERLSTDIRATVLAAPQQARLREMGLIPGGMVPAEFARMIDAEYDKWGKVVHSAGLQPE